MTMDSIIGFVYRFDNNDYQITLADIDEKDQEILMNMMDKYENVSSGVRGDKTITIEDANIEYFEQQKRRNIDMRIVEKQLYKITRHYGRSEFIEADNIDEVAKYVGESNRNGQTVMSVLEINLDGTHPRVAITKTKAYKEAVKGV